MLNRRAFLASLGFGTVAAAAAATGALDIERLLWSAGQKKIFIPEPRIIAPQMVAGDIFTIDGLFAVNPITGESTGYLQSFVVTSDVQSGSNVVSIAPRIDSDPVVPIDLIRKIKPMWTHIHAV